MAARKEKLKLLEESESDSDSGRRSSRSRGSSVDRSTMKATPRSKEKMDKEATESMNTIAEVMGEASLISPESQVAVHHAVSKCVDGLAAEHTQGVCSAAGVVPCHFGSSWEAEAQGLEDVQGHELGDGEDLLTAPTWQCACCLTVAVHLALWSSWKVFKRLEWRAGCLDLPFSVVCQGSGSGLCMSLLFAGISDVCTDPDDEGGGSALVEGVDGVGDDVRMGFASILSCLSLRFQLVMRLRMGRGEGGKFGARVGGRPPNAEVV
eukprot:2882446-Rhodomonas_salina.3